ncbi:MAG: pseudaminic acid biosynthesis-associated methylase [Planctomycetota bacterium]
MPHNDYPTVQETFWAGAFGDGYRQRNRSEDLLGRKTHLFARILERTRGIDSAMELGANIGLNLMAIRRLLPTTRLGAVEINQEAAAALRQSLPDAKCHVGSLLDLPDLGRWDLAFTSGVLIHIDPDHLPQAYDALHRLAIRYICVAEYYNPTPVTVDYRGEENRLFKRDFAGDLLDRFGDLELVDYGFAYRRDPIFPQDDGTWFLLEKRQPRSA